MRLIEDHILRKVHENVVLVPLSDRETDFKGMIVLNNTGKFVCQMLKQDIDREDLITGLAQEYQKRPEQLEEDVDTFLSELDACHLLIR